MGNQTEKKKKKRKPYSVIFSHNFATLRNQELRWTVKYGTNHVFSFILKYISYWSSRWVEGIFQERSFRHFQRQLPCGTQKPLATGLQFWNTWWTKILNRTYFTSPRNIRCRITRCGAIQGHRLTFAYFHNLAGFATLDTRRNCNRRNKISQN